MSSHVKLPEGIDRLPLDSRVLRLGRITRRTDDLILCEPIELLGGRDAVHTVLRRARISGRVDVGGEIETHFADVLNANGDLVETVALDSKSYSALKNRWLRCRVQR